MMKTCRSGPVRSAVARVASTLAGASLFLACTAATAEAQDSGGGLHVGPQINFADDTDIGVGVRVSGDLGGYPGWEIMGSFDLYFPESDVDFWEINGNVIYNIDARSTTVFPYAGGGLNVAHASFDGGPGNGGSDTEIGLNVLGGVKFATDGPLTPYAELRGTVDGSDQLVVTAGILFP